MAALRNADVTNIAAAHRHHTRGSRPLLALLGIT